MGGKCWVMIFRDGLRPYFQGFQGIFSNLKNLRVINDQKINVYFEGNVLFSLFSCIFQLCARATRAARAGSEKFQLSHLRTAFKIPKLVLDFPSASGRPPAGGGETADPPILTPLTKFFFFP